MEISDLIRGLLEAYPDGAKVTLTVDIEPKNMAVLPVTAETAKPQSVSPTTDDILSKVKAYEKERQEKKRAEAEASKLAEPEPETMEMYECIPDPIEDYEALNDDRSTLPELFKPIPQEKKRPGKRAVLDLDMGKVKALRAAGWTYAKIADEMRCSSQTIINKLKAEEENEG